MSDLNLVIKQNVPADNRYSALRTALRDYATRVYAQDDQIVINFVFQGLSYGDAVNYLGAASDGELHELTERTYVRRTAMEMLNF